MRYALTEDQQAEFLVGAALTELFDRAYWQDHISRRAFPRELWSELGRRGHLGTLVSRDRGGAGRTLLDLVLLTEGLAAAGFPLLALVTGPGLAIPAIAAHGSGPIRDEVLGPLLTGDELVAFAVTEAEAGSNLMNVETSVEGHGADVVLRGGKVLTSLADEAAHTLVVARTDEPEKGRLGFSVVLVPRDHPGVTVTPMATTVSAAERQCRLDLDEVVLAADHVVGGLGGGLRVLFPAIVAERALSGALSCGVGQYAIVTARDHTLQRRLFDAPLATHQGVQHPLAEATALLAGARHLVRQAALADVDGDADAMGIANMAVLAAGRAGHQAADAALQSLGGMGYTRAGELHDMLGMSRLLRSAPVNSESALSAIGELVLGMPRSY